MVYGKPPDGRLLELLEGFSARTGIAVLYDAPDNPYAVKAANSYFESRIELYDLGSAGDAESPTRKITLPDKTIIKVKGNYVVHGTSVNGGEKAILPFVYERVSDKVAAVRLGAKVFMSISLYNMFNKANCSWAEGGNGKQIPAEAFFLQVVEPLLLNAAKAAAEGDAEMCKEWVGLRGKRYGDMVAVWQKELDAYKQQAINALSEMRKAETEILKRSDSIDAFHRFTKVERERAATDEFHALRKMVSAGAVANIRQDDRHVIFEVPKFMFEWDDKGYMFGPYQVTIDMQNATMRIMPTGDCANVHGYIHPHITDHGDCCVGSAGEQLARAVASGSMIEMVTVVLQYLRSYSEKYAYKNAELAQWKFVDPQKEHAKRREACFKAVMPRQCVVCKDRDCPHKTDAEASCFKLMKVQDGACAACLKCEAGAAFAKKGDTGSDIANAILDGV
jgi:hypothetical protein